MTSNGGEKISVSAPGDNVYSTVKDGYAMDGGTSMAAPMVAGAVAGIWSIYPGNDRSRSKKCDSRNWRR